MKARDYARVADEITEDVDLGPAQMAKKVKALQNTVRDQIKERRELGLSALRCTHPK